MENKHIEFLKEYAKCGIHHNYTEPESKLNVMNEAVNYLSSLQSEIDRFKGEYTSAAMKAIELVGEVDRLKEDKIGIVKKLVELKNEIDIISKNTGADKPHSFATLSAKVMIDSLLTRIK